MKTRKRSALVRTIYGYTTAPDAKTTDALVEYLDVWLAAMARAKAIGLTVPACNCSVK